MLDDSSDECVQVQNPKSTSARLDWILKKKNGGVISAMMTVETVGSSWWAEPSGSLTRTRIPITGAKRNLQKGNY